MQRGVLGQNAAGIQASHAVEQHDPALFNKDEWRTIRKLVAWADGYVDRLVSFKVVRKIAPYVPGPTKRLLVAFLSLLKSEKEMTKRIKKGKRGSVSYA